MQLDGNVFVEKKNQIRGRPRAPRLARASVGETAGSGTYRTTDMRPATRACGKRRVHRLEELVRLRRRTVDAYRTTEDGKKNNDSGGAPSHRRVRAGRKQLPDSELLAPTATPAAPIIVVVAVMIAVIVVKVLRTAGTVRTGRGERRARLQRKNRWSNVCQFFGELPT